MTLWEAAGTFPAACRGLVAASQRPTKSSWAMHAAALHGAMMGAHVVTCPARQVESLPPIGSMDDAAAYARALAPPFPATYLCLGEACRAEPTPEGILGCLLLQYDAPVRWPGGGRIDVRLLLGEASERADARYMLIPFFRRGERVAFHGGAAVADEGEYGLIVESFPSEESEANPDGKQERLDMLMCAAERTLAVLILLDNVVGVELREKDRREVSRQAIRHATRKGARIAWTVAIAAPKRSTRGASASGNKANYSHRFERAANFACFTKGPHVSDPEKLSSWCPRHGAKACRREFRPATIVGPADLPLVPKIRHVTGARPS